MPNVGAMELALVLIIALLVLGPKRLPEMGRSVGRGVREFRNAMSIDDDSDRRTAVIDEGPERSEAAEHSEVEEDSEEPRHSEPPRESPAAKGARPEITVARDPPSPGDPLAPPRRTSLYVPP